MESVPDLDAALWQSDCVVIVTDHSLYDWSWAIEQTPLVVETRYATADVVASEA